MAYMILQENSGTDAFAFKVLARGWKMDINRVQREQPTVEGYLDVQSGPILKQWNYVIKLYGEDTGNITGLSPGAIVTATTVKWGDLVDLKSLFDNVVPPSNRLRFRDLDGEEYYVHFSGSLKPSPVTNVVSGPYAYMNIEILMKESK